MEGLFFGGSLLAAFLAGAVALFAPCCIVVLFPSYLAAAVRNSRWRLVPLTLVFAAGIAVVLVPVTLGLGILARGLLRFHGATYVVGGMLMLLLAGLALTGRGWTMPFLRGAPDVERTDTGGVFVLGVFSGAASACCAPVLTGVLTLSAVAPSMVQSVGIGLAYVFGMVFPLVILAAGWDRLGSRGRARVRGRQRQVRLAGRSFTVSTLDLAAGAMYSLMGIVLIVIGVTGATLAPVGQAAVGSWLEDRLVPLTEALAPVPDLVVGLVLVLFAAGAIAISGRRRTADSQPDTTAEEHCHDTHAESAAQEEAGDAAETRH